MLNSITVIHFILTIEGAIAELPLVLTGQDPPTKSSKYSDPPKAVIFGSGYDDVAIDEILEGIGGTGVPLLKADQSIPMPPTGPEYRRRSLERSKAKLAELTKEGKHEDGQRGVFLY